MILAFGLKAEVGGTRRDIWLTLVADRADIKFADRLHAARCALDILQHNIVDTTCASARPSETVIVYFVCRQLDVDTLPLTTRTAEPATRAAGTDRFVPVFKLRRVLVICRLGLSD